MTLVSQHRVQPLDPGWVRYLNHRLPGETPGVNDDFFTDDSPPGTELTVSGTATWNEEYGRLGVVYDDQTSGDAAARVITLTSPSAPLTVETRQTIGGYPNTVLSAGIGLSNGAIATSDIVSAMWFISGTTYGWRARFGTLTSLYATTNTTVGLDRNVAFAIEPLYMRVIWVAANSFKVGYKQGEAPWVYASLTPTFTPTHAALFGSTDGSNQPGFNSFDYLRVTAADLSI